MSTNPHEVKRSAEEKNLQEFLTRSLGIIRDADKLHPYKRFSQGEEADEQLTVHYNLQFPVPRMPMFHPYNPITDTNPQTEASGSTGIPHTVLTLKCPPKTSEFLPESIKNLLTSSGTPPEKIDVFVVSQNTPWAAAPLLMRPHYWMHGRPLDHDKTITDRKGINTQCQIAICSTNPDPNNPISCDGMQNTFTPKLDMSSHGSNKPTEVIQGSICSPDGIGVLSGISANQTTSFFSIVKILDGPTAGRIAVTLHWLLNDKDEVALERAARFLKGSDREQTLATFILEIHSKIPSLSEPLKDLLMIFNSNVAEIQNLVKPATPKAPEAPPAKAADAITATLQAYQAAQEQAKKADEEKARAEALAKEDAKAAEDSASAELAQKFLDDELDADANRRKLEAKAEADFEEFRRTEAMTQEDGKLAANLAAAELTQTPIDPELAAQIDAINKAAERYAKEEEETALQKALQESQTTQTEDAALAQAIRESLEPQQPQLPKKPPPPPPPPPPKLG